MFDEVGVARVVERRGERLSQADAFVELSQRQQAGVGRERGLGYLDLDGQRLEKVELQQASRCILIDYSQGTERDRVVLQVRRAGGPKIPEPPRGVGRGRSP